MQTTSDLIYLPYSEDLTRAGLLYALRSLPYTYDRMGGSPFERLRRIVAGKVVELAFRRCLEEQQVPYGLLGLTPFTDPDRYDVAIGGRQCDLKSFTILTKDKIRQIRRNPDALLEAAALVPSDQLVSESLSDEDLYIFAFFTALVTPDRETLGRAISAGQPFYLVHPLPDTWSHPARWVSLSPLSLKTETALDFSLELGGQRLERTFQTEEITLIPGKVAKANKPFYSVAYLHILEYPKARIAIYSPRMGKPYIILPSDWGNIWVYGLDIILAGYMTRGEFRRLAQPLPAGSQVFQYPRTRTHNHILPISALHPLGELFSRAREWQMSEKS